MSSGCLPGIRRAHPPGVSRDSGSSQRARGFTLVEVLVALAAMALLAALAWQGLDSVLRSRDASRVAVDDVVRLATVLTQWEQDLQAVHDTVAVPPLDFDGQTLRLTRRSEGGVALVCWALRGGAWQRWASPIYTRSNDIRAVWMRSQQFQGAEPGQLQVAAGASEWQIYFYRGNGWSNAQSTGDQQEVAALPKAGVAAPAARPPAPDDGPGRVDGGTPPVAVLPAAAAAPVPAASPRQPMAEQLPAAVRLVITIGGKKLTRDVALGPSGS